MSTERLRIVSLLSAATEMVCALGKGDSLVGISHECDYPPEILNRPVVTETKVHPNGSSLEIDSQVRRLVQEGLSIYRIKTDVLRQLRPDIILTQQQCQVCAVTFQDVLAAVAGLLEYSPQVISLEPMRFEDIFRDILRVGQAIQSQAGAELLISKLYWRVGRVVVATQDVPCRPRVLCIEWIEPLMVAGNWIPEMVEMAGGMSLLGKAGDHAPIVEWDDVVESAPEIIIVAPCGFSLEQTRREYDRLDSLPGWNKLPAVERGRVYFADGVSYFNRSGPRMVDSLEMLAAMIHPEIGRPLLQPGSESKFRQVSLATNQATP
jgi:iron complex transport system substrate-binding protein